MINEDTLAQINAALSGDPVIPGETTPPTVELTLPDSIPLAEQQPHEPVAQEVRFVAGPASPSPIPEPSVTLDPPAPEPEPKDQLFEMLEAKVRFNSRRRIGPYSTRNATALRSWLSTTTNAQEFGEPEERFPIKEEDLIVLEKILAGKIPGSRGSRARILQHINKYKEEKEITNYFQRLERIVRR